MTGVHHDVDGIVTPEAVVLRFAEAGIPSRTLAYAIDLLVMGGLLFALFFAGTFIFATVSGTAALIAVVIGLFLVLFGYRAIQETLWNGQTVGKRAVGLRVITVEGAPVRFRHVAIRTALDFVDVFLSLGGVALVSMMLSRHSQRLGDLAAGTVVVHVPSNRNRGQAMSFRPLAGWEDYARRLDTSHLRPTQYTVIRAFLGRVQELSPEARWRIAAELATRVSTTITAPIPGSGHPEAYLVAVVAAHQARTATTAAASPPPAVSTPLPPPTGWRVGATAS